MGSFLMKASILSISLLTVMASAAISPALAKISQAFAGTDKTLIKLVLTLPSLLIIPFSLLCGWLVSKTKKKYILLIGLIIYLIGGLGGALAHSITQLLIIRALFGVGVGLIIPLSTSLIADYFSGDQRTKMMGLSGSVSHLGGVIFLLVSGWLACISWRYAFAVYGLAAVILLMVLFWLPDTDSKQAQKTVKSKLPWGIYFYSLLGALMMIAFYAAPTNLAMFIESDRKMYSTQAPIFKDKAELESSLLTGALSDSARQSLKGNGIVISEKAKFAVEEAGKSWNIIDSSKKYLVKKEKDGLVVYAERLGRPGIAGYYLSTMTFVGVVAGVVLALLMRWCGPYFVGLGIGAMAIGYGLLAGTSSLLWVLVSMVCIGFSSGVLMPILLLETAKITPADSRAFSMAVVSVGIYLGQFMSPLVLKWAGTLMGTDMFRSQFNFLTLGLIIATVIALIIGFKNRKNFKAPENIRAH